MLLALLLTVSAGLTDGGLDEPPDAGEVEVHLAVPIAPALPPDAGAPPPPVVAAPVPEDAGTPEPPSGVTIRGSAETDLGLFPSGFAENGLDFMTTVRPTLGFSVNDDFTLEFGPTFRLRIIDTPALNRASDVGGFLRGADWDEVSDFGQILKALRIAKSTSVFHLRVEPVRKKSLGLGHVLWRYSNQTNADYHPVAADAVLRVGPIRAELFASDVLAARLFAGEVAWDLGATFSSDVEVKDRYVLALQLAHDVGLAGRPFRPDPGAPIFTPPPATLLHLDASAVLVRSAGLRWMVLTGVGNRDIASDLGFLVGTTIDATAKEVGFSARLELRKQAGGFRHGFFGPMYELQRYADLGFSGPSIATARLPDGLSGFAEIRAGIGSRLTFELAAEYFFWNRLDLDGGFSLALVDDRFLLTLRTTVLGLAQTPRFAFNAGLRWRLFPSFYVLGEGGTVFFPQVDGTLSRGATFSLGAGVDFER